MYSVKLEDVVKEVAKCLKLSVTKTEQMISDIENDKAGRWMDLIYEKCDDNLVARFKVAANIIDEPDENDGEYDDYPTEERYYVYDASDNCVSDEFQDEETAIEWAKNKNLPVVKIHKYYRDPSRGYKLYPDGYPEIVWEA